MAERARACSFYTLSACNTRTQQILAKPRKASQTLAVHTQHPPQHTPQHTCNTLRNTLRNTLVTRTTAHSATHLHTATHASMFPIALPPIPRMLHRMPMPGKAASVDTVIVEVVQNRADSANAASVTTATTNRIKPKTKWLGWVLTKIRSRGRSIAEEGAPKPPMAPTTTPTPIQLSIFPTVEGANFLHPVLRAMLRSLNQRGPATIGLFRKSANARCAESPEIHLSGASPCRLPPLHTKISFSPQGCA